MQAKIEVLENRKMRTEVYVNGKLAYESANAIPIEKKNIRRLLRLLDGEELEEEIDDTTSP